MTEGLRLVRDLRLHYYETKTHVPTLESKQETLCVVT